MEYQKQYAWIVSVIQCVSIQAVNEAVGKVLEIFRLRSSPPTRSFPMVSPEKSPSKWEQVRYDAKNLVSEYDGAL